MRCNIQILRPSGHWPIPTMVIHRHRFATPPWPDLGVRFQYVRWGRVDHEG